MGENFFLNIYNNLGFFLKKRGLTGIHWKWIFVNYSLPKARLGD